MSPSTINVARRASTACAAEGELWAWPASCSSRSQTRPLRRASVEVQVADCTALRLVDSRGLTGKGHLGG
jgi:hypothetical protein